MARQLSINHFTMKPQGQHTCVVCTGTACYIKGAADLLKSIDDAEGVKPGETTPDGELERSDRALFWRLRPGAGSGDGWRSGGPPDRRKF